MLDAWRQAIPDHQTLHSRDWRGFRLQAVSGQLSASVLKSAGREAVPSMYSPARTRIRSQRDGRWGVARARKPQRPGRCEPSVRQHITTASNVDRVVAPGHHPSRACRNAGFINLGELSGNIWTTHLH